MVTAYGVDDARPAGCVATFGAMVFEVPNQFFVSPALVAVESKLPVAVWPGMGGKGETIAVADINGLELDHCDLLMGS
jgi:hypothetical protein